MDVRIFMAGLALFMVEGVETTAAVPERSFQPRGSIRLIGNYDNTGLWLWATNNEPEQFKRLLEQRVHLHAESGFDMIVQCTFARFTHVLHPSVSQFVPTVYPAKSNSTRWSAPIKRLHDAGFDLFQIALDQAHRDGLLCLAGLRMNDRHGVSTLENIYKSHPQWRLAGYAGGFDYSKKPVRDAMLAFVRDVLDRYDVDGVEYDWMRWVNVFPDGTWERHAPLLTEFHRHTRQILDEFGAKRGRRLLLGARVPHLLDRCLPTGFDVKAWIADGLVDYVNPSHFGHMDYNARIEDFRKLTKDSPCRVFASTQGTRWTGPCRLKEYGPAHYYAAAHNYYAFGADAISTYNYYTDELMVMKPLADMEDLSRQNRDYLFCRLREPLVASNAAAMQYDVIHLDRTTNPAEGTFDFRLAENLSDPQVSAVLEFKAVGMSNEENLAVGINGRATDTDRVQRRRSDDGGYVLHSVRLEPGDVRFGDNRLTVRLAKAAGKDGAVRIEEVNVRIEVNAR